MKLVLLISLLACVLCHLVSAEINPAHLGGTFSRSSREPKYKIEFHSEDSPFHPEDDQESVVMPNQNGQNFICYLPKVEEAKSGKPVLQQNTSSMIVETEKRVKVKTPDELLEVLKDQPCFIRHEGWWSYEFCYQKRLRQIHLEDEKVVQEFVLGVYDAEATAAFNQKLLTLFSFRFCFLISLVLTLYAFFRLFQQETVWQIINCNVLPKDYEETKVEEEESEIKQIVMVTDSESPSNDDDLE